MEDEEGIGLVLARAIDLRLKISDCIEKATGNKQGHEGFEKNSKLDGEVRDGDERVFEEDDEDDDEEAERLLHIRDALESLESQLSSLQNLRQRQQYEKQVALSEIDYSRKMLLEKLKEYKGKDLEVIHETSAFAGEKVEYENDLLLPPYPSRPPLSLVSDNGYPSPLTSKRKSVQNGLVVPNPTNGAKKDRHELQNTKKGVGGFIISAAKLMLPIAGVISILCLSGLGPEIRKRSVPLKLMSILQPRENEEERSSSVKCPPGKVLVVENGETRCVVKERVEIPFESIGAKRDVNYGYG